MQTTTLSPSLSNCQQLDRRLPLVVPTRAVYIFQLGLWVGGLLNAHCAQASPPSLGDSDYYGNIIPRVGFTHDYVFDESESEVTTSSKNLVLEGLLSSFDVPWDDLYNKRYGDEWKNLFNGLSGGFSLGYPLQQSKQVSNNGGATQGGLEANNITASASFKYKPLGNWFVSTALFAYKNKALQAPWNPDFVYSFGYSDWRPYTLSLVYANYGGNRWNPDRSHGERVTVFKQGAWTLGWKFPVSKRISRWFTFNENGRVGCNVSYTVVPQYFDSGSNSLKRWRRNMALGCKYSIWGNWYVNANVFHYFNPSQQQPWNPDFTYGFGYFDWRPGTITVQYNNYSGNRFPGRTRAKNTGQFKNGGINIAWSWVY